MKVRTASKMAPAKRGPWSGCPHCPECHRRLWIAQNNSGRDITPPTTDMHCPHCNADLLKGRP